MSEEKLKVVYHEIAELINDTIPENWSEVYLYGEIVEGAQTAYFYYYPEGNDQPVYSNNIPDLFDIPEEDYKEMWHQLLDSLLRLWKVFKDDNKEPWTNLTMYLNHSGKFKVHFNYDDLSNVNSHERKTIWAYKHLGILPKSKSGKKFLEKYLQTTKVNNE
ncbi:antitoxin YezG family protein [Laceyella tengchongensis]